ncbi:hypothetical protein D4L85_08735 [Chryseolinea soli]|uniref:Uncharacterized protein n=1 Tax=Chryseolinea soli TaxID=2321403 RepID=A0A385SK62_9BACT|nr:hypothetical protein D4L85_08735 [Chryseolinea soli]
MLHEVIPQFNERRFIFRIFNTEWPDLALKQRTHQVTMALHEALPKEFPAAAKMIDAIALRLRQQKENERYYPFMFLVEYLERYGQHHLEEVSRKAISFKTKEAAPQRAASA